MHGLWQEVRPRLWWFLIAGTVSLVGAWIYLSSTPLMYSSSVLVVIRSGEPLMHGEDVQYFLPSPESTRLVHAATSTEMTDHLIERFDLYTHYNVPRKSQDAYTRVTTMLLDRMSVSVPDGVGLTITIRDEDRTSAAAMANATFDKLLAMTELQKAAIMQRNLDLYDILIRATRARSDTMNLELSELLSNVNNGQRALSRSMSDERIQDLGMRITDLIVQIGNSHQNLLSMHQRYDAFQTMASSVPTHELQLVRKAMEDIRTTPTSRAFRIILPLLALVLVTVLVLITALYMHGTQHG